MNYVYLHFTLMVCFKTNFLLQDNKYIPEHHWPHSVSVFLLLLFFVVVAMKLLTNFRHYICLHMSPLSVYICPADRGRSGTVPQLSAGGV